MEFRLIKFGFALLILGFIFPGYSQQKNTKKVLFPEKQPKNANFNKPANHSVLDISTPGFCWWRAGERNEVFYVLHIFNEDGKEILTTNTLEEPVFVPTTPLSPGNYYWTVSAVDKEGKVLDTREKSYFEITQNAISLPWPEPKQLLNKVPEEHPRLLFTKKKIEEIKGELNTTYRSTFLKLKESADAGLSLPLVEEPDFHKITGRENYSAKRTEYRVDYHAVGETYINGVVPMALTYLLSGEEKYGLAVKKHLLHLTDWELSGSLAVDDPKFDEVGLRLARALPQAYDWTYGLYTPEEIRKIENWLSKLADNFLIRMKERDFLNFSGESHDGRVPGYLIEFALALAHRPEAESWLDYALKASLTVFPHWAGSDGGWAEGVDYALQYNSRFITPIQSLLIATGYNLWEKPFFRKFPYFLTYCLSPVGEITPFGDSENQAVSGDKADKLSSMLLFYALQNEDAVLKWWSEKFKENARTEDDTDDLSALRELIVDDNLEPTKPVALKQDRSFFGVGWAALHSQITDAKNDLMVLFKSSPFGPVSHSHLDQNSFAIMKGGKALALPAGERYPQHGSPFHTQYTRLTKAHNTLIINGAGQIDKDGSANGHLTDFKSMNHIGYVAGEAQAAYGEEVTGFKRHVILIRPSIVIILDEVESASDGPVEWLLHGKEKFRIEDDQDSFISTRKDELMKVQLFTPAGFLIEQNNKWPIDPKQGYPMVKTESPEEQWHLTATTRNSSSKKVIAAVMSVDEQGLFPKINYTEINEEEVVFNVQFLDGDKADVQINMNQQNDTPNTNLIHINYLTKKGDKEHLTVPKN